MDASTLAQVTGSKQATVRVEHRDPQTGDLVTDSVDIYDRLDSYGVRYEGEQGYTPTEDFMSLAELASRNGRISCVRWIGGEYIPGRGRCYDLSYVHGALPDGTEVSITHLPAAFLVPRRGLKGALIEWAKDQGVYAKGIGLLDEGCFSILG